MGFIEKTLKQRGRLSVASAILIYTAAYRLRTDNHTLTGVILLDARSRGATLANATVDAGRLPQGRWSEVTLEFSVDAVSTDLELRGILLSGYPDVRLDHVRLTQR